MEALRSFPGYATSATRGALGACLQPTTLLKPQFSFVAVLRHCAPYSRSEASAACDGCRHASVSAQSLQRGMSPSAETRFDLSVHTRSNSESKADCMYLRYRPAVMMITFIRRKSSYELAYACERQEVNCKIGVVHISFRHTKRPTQADKLTPT
eukprot:4801557-Pleurochrysis_carterae.AAC.2